jgi:uncharacterized protein YceH (UPF0502 family)
MELTPAEARVLACLIEKEVAVPDSYPLTLNALRLACNQTTNRHPVVAYDDRTVEAALLSLKSMGLVRFVHPSHGGRTVRYRHAAADRWRLSPSELGAIAVLVLRGPQTTSEVRSRADRHFTADEDPTSADDVLDALAARSPDPFVARLERRAGEREPRWAEVLTSGEAQTDVVADDGTPAAPDRDQPDAPAEPRSAPALVQPAARRGADDDLARDVAELWARVERLERLLGLNEELDDVDDLEGLRSS